jgi:hypothetical protein
MNTAIIKNNGRQYFFGGFAANGQLFLTDSVDGAASVTADALNKWQKDHGKKVAFDIVRVG